MSTLILNAGLGGAQGNSQVVAERCQEVLRERAMAHEAVVLRDVATSDVEAALRRAERLVIISGTYWGGFSSLLQRLLEELTSTEGTDLWLGKPASVLVTAHQVGAQTVLWRLQGVLVTLGCLIPPMSGVVITRTGEDLRRLAPAQCEDVWGLEDVATALANLQATPYARSAYESWPVDRAHFRERWLDGTSR